MNRILEVTDNLVVDMRAREWCRLPYPNHPSGCPNYNKKYSCPPNAIEINDWLGDYRKIWFVCVSFDLKCHIGRMLELHPTWTLRQARCLLYWQPKVNKKLQEVTYTFAPDRLNGVTYCPEAMGVQVIETARNAGLPIETKPENIVWKIALCKV